jgi:hypothetical protein
VRTTIITTSEPARFAAVTAASGLGLSPFMLDARSGKRTESTAYHGPGRMPVILARGATGRAMPRFAVLEGGAAQRARLPGGGFGPSRRTRSA